YTQYAHCVCICVCVCVCVCVRTVCVCLHGSTHSLARRVGLTHTLWLDGSVSDSRHLTLQLSCASFHSPTARNTSQDTGCVCVLCVCVCALTVCARTVCMCVCTFC